MEEYCFSTPLTYLDSKGRSSPIEVFMVYIVKKENNLRSNELTDLDESKLFNLGIYDLLMDVDECVFEPFDSKLKKEDLFMRLSKLGLNHEPSLDSLLQDWITQKQEEDHTYNHPALKGRKFNKNYPE